MRTRPIELPFLLFLVSTACATTSGAPSEIRDAGDDVLSPDGGTEASGGPSCATIDAGGVRTIAQLPTGACGASGACDFLVWHECPCKTEHAAMDAYRCRCDGAAWSCERTGVGATACQLTDQCVPKFVDAAAD